MNGRAPEPSRVKLTTCPLLTSVQDIPNSKVIDDDQTRGANVPIVLDSFLPARPNIFHVFIWYTFYTCQSRSQPSTLPVIPNNHLYSNGQQIMFLFLQCHSLHEQGQSLQGFPPRTSPSQQSHCPFQIHICIQMKNFLIRVRILLYSMHLRTNGSIRNQIPSNCSVLHLQMLSLLPSQNSPKPSPFPSGSPIPSTAVPLSCQQQFQEQLFSAAKQSSTYSPLLAVPSQQEFPLQKQCPYMEQFFPHFSHPPFPLTMGDSPFSRES
jgi:hypothetical protein